MTSSIQSQQPGGRLTAMFALGACGEGKPAQLAERSEGGAGGLFALQAGQGVVAEQSEEIMIQQGGPAPLAQLVVQLTLNHVGTRCIAGLNP